MKASAWWALARRSSSSRPEDRETDKTLDKKSTSVLHAQPQTQYSGDVMQSEGKSVKKRGEERGEGQWRAGRQRGTHGDETVSRLCIFHEH